MRVSRVSPLAVVILVAAIGCGIVACFGPDSRAVRSAEGDAAAFDLRPEERQMVSIFRDASPSVVFIASNVVRRRFLSPNIEEVPRGSGSGFVWDRNGHIVTNYHVIRDFVESGGRGTSITVTLQDRTVYRVEQIVGSYVDKELAVLRIAAPAEKLHPISIGRSKDLVVGQTAIAIGNPFGLDYTLTVGVLSALGREIQALSGRRISDVIQTDAAINPGNSGGPLLNSAGQLIGMNTAIISPSGASAGIGFAIPIDTIRRYVDQMIQNKGEISGAGLGIVLWQDAVTAQLGLKGVLVRDVPAGSAGAKAGLRGTRLARDGEVEQLGDVIVRIDDSTVGDLDSLRNILENHAVDDEVTVTYLREGQERKATARLQKIEYR